jgi:hypothetical protein
MKNLRLNLIIITALTAASATFAQNETLPYTLYIVRPAINNYAVMPDAPLPGTCKRETTMKIMTCRGEYEPASFVVKTDKPLTGVRIEVEPLSGPAGTIAPEAVDVRLVQVVFRRITDWPALCPWLLVHDPGLIVVDENPHPMALRDNALEHWKAYTHTNRLTREPVDTEHLQPVDIDTVRQFWITVHMPEDAPAGIYTSNVTVRPDNAAASALTLQVTVPDFELLPPMFEYSVYYPVYFGRNLPPENPHSFGDMTDEQYLAELKNMVAHGCTNPNIYQAPDAREDGTVDFAILENIIRLREQAGMRKGPLFLPNHPLKIAPRQLTEDERAFNHRYIREVVAWCKERGYPEVYFYLMDEASGETLRGERDSIKSIHEAGARTYVACGGDFYDLVGDLLDLPILLHPGHGRIDMVGHYVHGHLRGPEAVREPAELLAAGGAHVLLEPGIQRQIQGVHKNGFKIYTYMDPIGGQSLPELHRRDRGLGLWKAGLDGTMTWAYTHITNNALTDFPPGLSAQAHQSMFFGVVFRGKNSVIDTLGWEGFREGVDDARYLTTLLETLKQSKAAGKHIDLVDNTEQWLESVPIDADLNAMRLEMARRIEALLQP